MFGRLSDLVENVLSLSVDEAIHSSIVREPIQNKVIELNTRGQLFNKGIDAEGKLLSDIGGRYSPYTMQVANKRSPNLIDLHDTGDFYRSFRVLPVKDGFVIEADTIKEGEDLRDSWGNDIVGLTDLSMEILAEAMLQDVREYALDKMLS